MRFFGILVNKGHLDKADVYKCINLAQEEAQAASDGKPPRTLSEIAVSLRIIERSRLEQLQRTGGEDIGTIPGLEILAKVGEGGTANVFRAQEKKSGRQIAIKILHQPLFSDRLSRERFINEAKLLIDLDHKNFVKGFKVGRVGEDRLAFVMEFVDGLSVQEHLNNGHEFNEDAALYVILQAAQALEYLRERGLVHRDIKPDNIMLTRDNTVKLIDLGFATKVGESAVEESDTTLGTVHFISPEQARGRSVDIRSDIYSLGATLYKMVVGSYAYDGDDPDEIMAKQILESLSSPELKRKVSPYVHYFLEKMMAKDPDIRYQDPAELIQDIEGQIEGKKTAFEVPGAESNPDLLQKPFESGPEEAPKKRPIEIRKRRRR